MEAGLLTVVLGVVMVQVHTASQDLDLQKIAGFWREFGVASSQNLAPKTPKRLEALFLTLSRRELTVKVVYNRLSLRWQGKDYHVLKYFTRSLEDEYGPGIRTFRDLTADMGLDLVAWHGRCAKLLKEELI